ncbi:hypothetical protein D3C81_954600 [compost metagenome]
MFLRHPADVFAHRRVGRGELLHAIRRLQLLAHRLHQLLALLVIGRTAQHRPTLRVDKDPTLLVLADPKYDVIVRDAPSIPLSIPQVAVNRCVCLLRRRPVFPRDLRPPAVVANVSPHLECVGRGDGQPAGHAFAFVADHVHRVAPVTLVNVVQPALIPVIHQPAHGFVNMSINGLGLPAVGISHLLLQNGVVSRFVQIRAQANWQPDAMVRMRNLVNVFQLGVRVQDNAVWHSAVRLLLAERRQERSPRHLRLEVTHAHVILQIIAGLRIGGQTVRLPVVINLPRQPAIDEQIEILVRR